MTIELHNETIPRGNNDYPNLDFLTHFHDQLTGHIDHDQLDGGPAAIRCVHDSSRADPESVIDTEQGRRPLIRDELFGPKDPTTGDYRMHTAAALRKFWYRWYTASTQRGSYMGYYDFVAYRNHGGCPQGNTDPDCQTFEEHIASGGAFLATLKRLSNLNDIANTSGASTGTPYHVWSANNGNTEQLHFLQDIPAGASFTASVSPGNYLVEYRDTQAIGTAPLSIGRWSRLALDGASGSLQVGYSDPDQNTGTGDDLSLVILPTTDAVPVVTSVSPAPFCAGANGTLGGSGFTNAAAIELHSEVGTNDFSAAFIVDSDSQISFTVPSGMPQGRYYLAVLKNISVQGAPLRAASDPVLVQVGAPSTAFLASVAGGSPAGSYCRDGKGCRADATPSAGGGYPTFNLKFWPVAPCTGCSYAWRFGDGTGGQGFPVLHAFPVGEYTVTLTVTDPCQQKLVNSVKDFVYYRGDKVDAEIVAGIGEGPATPGKDYDSTVRGFRFNGGNALPIPGSPELTAYGTKSAGVNVAVGRVKGTAPGVHSYILTGPGPNPSFGPHVRAFDADNAPISRVSFYAYGTLKYGVNVTTAQLTDPFAERRAIITGAGAGAVFGPHVRGWYLPTQGPLQAIAGVNFFAYGTLKWGVNVSSGDVVPRGLNQPPDKDEILTGPGPGLGFGPQVRAFRKRTGEAAKALGNVNFFAYSDPPTGFTSGVHVAGVDWDADGRAELVTAPGPDPSATALIRAWNVGSYGTAAAAAQAFAGNGYKYGAYVAGGEITAVKQGDEVVVTPGPDPAADPEIEVYGVDPIPGGYDFTRIGTSFLPYPSYTFGTSRFLEYGAKVAVVPTGEALISGKQDTTDFWSSKLLTVRNLIAPTPDSKTIDYSLDPTATIDINVWNDDAKKQTALAALDGILSNLADQPSSAIVAALQTARDAVAAGPTNPMAHDESVAALDELIAHYQQPDLPSGAVVARKTFPESPATYPKLVASSPLVPDTAYLVRESQHVPACYPCFPTSYIDKLSLSDLSVVREQEIEGSISDIRVSIPDAKLYGLDARTVVGGSCPPKGPCLKLLLVAGQLDLFDDPPVTQTIIAEVPFERQTLRTLYLLPTIQNPALPPKAYIAAAAGIGYPHLYVVEDLAQVPNSPVSDLTHQTQWYRDMVGSPVPGDSRIFAIYPADGTAPGGLDIIDSQTDAITERAITSFYGDRLQAGETAPGVYRILALDRQSGLVTSYDPVAGAVMAQATEPGARDIALTPDGKELLALIGTNRLDVMDPQSLLLNRPLAIGQSTSDLTRIAVAADGVTVLVTDQGTDVLEVVEIGNPALGTGTAGLTTVIQSIPDSAFTGGGGAFRFDHALLQAAKRRMRGDDEQGDDDDDDDDGPRAKLLKEIAKVAHEIAKAEEERNEGEDPKKVNKHLEKAAKRIYDKILPRIDGFFGGDPKDDWIVTEEAQKLIRPLVLAIATDVELAHIQIPGPPPVL